MTAVGQWAGDGDAGLFPTGNRLSLGGRNVISTVFETGRPAGIDEYENASGPIGEALWARGVRSATGVPITVDRRLWGAMVVGSRVRKVPLGTEDRLEGLNELVATALANAEAQAELSASRARLLAASDTSRRRFERDLRQGAQHRLAELALYLRGPVCAAVPPAADDLVAQVEQLADEVSDVLDELREIAGGLHPTALAQGGLEPALTTLARRSSIPVRLGLDLDGRLPEPVELTAYYTVAEALTNAAKHAQASTVDVDVEISDGRLHVRVSDDGCGGANPAAGSGLIGLTDRVESLGGVLALCSQPDVGTTVEITRATPAAGPAVATWRSPVITCETWRSGTVRPRAGRWDLRGLHVRRPRCVRGGPARPFRGPASLLPRRRRCRSPRFGRRGQWKGDAQRGAPSGWALQLEPPAERLDPVGQRDQAGAAAGVGATDAVVADAQVQLPLVMCASTSTTPACAYLAALARASATAK